MNTTTVSLMIMVGAASVGVVGFDNAMLFSRPPIRFVIHDILINEETGKIAVRRESNVPNLNVTMSVKVQNTNTRKTLCGQTVTATIERQHDNLWGPYDLDTVVRDDCAAAHGQWVDLVLSAHWQGRDGSARFTEAISNPFMVTEVFY